MVWTIVLLFCFILYLNGCCILYIERLVISSGLGMMCSYCHIWTYLYVHKLCKKCLKIPKE